MKVKISCQCTACHQGFGKVVDRRPQGTYHARCPGCETVQRISITDQQRLWDMDDKKGFGSRYATEPIWWIIQHDPEHVQWLCRNVEWFQLDEEAQDALYNATGYDGWN